MPCGCRRRGGLEVSPLRSRQVRPKPSLSGRPFVPSTPTEVTVGAPQRGPGPSGHPLPGAEAPLAVPAVRRAFPLRPPRRPPRACGPDLSAVSTSLRFGRSLPFGVGPPASSRSSGFPVVRSVRRRTGPQPAEARSDSPSGAEAPSGTPSRTEALSRAAAAFRLRPVARSRSAETVPSWAVLWCPPRRRPKPSPWWPGNRVLRTCLLRAEALPRPATQASPLPSGSAEASP